MGSCNKTVTDVVPNKGASNQNEVIQGSVKDVMGQQVPEVIKNDVYKDRFVYNSDVNLKQIEALFAKKNNPKCDNNSHGFTVYGQVFRASVKAAHKVGQTPNCKEISAYGSANDQTFSRHVKDLNPSPLTSTTAEVMSGPSPLARWLH